MAETVTEPTERLDPLAELCPQSRVEWFAGAAICSTCRRPVMRRSIDTGWEHR